jgi:multiple sugar transport system permease protein
MSTGRRHTFVRRMSARIDRLGDGRFALLSFAPGGLLLAIFVIPPIAAVLVMSLMRIELLRDGVSRFVGADNYLTRLPNDSNFLQAVPRTSILALGVVLLTVPIALGCALLMNRRSKLSWIIGILVLVPWAVAPVVTGLYWKFIFNSQYGLATQIVNWLGIRDGPVNWLESSRTAMVIAVVATAWRMVPLMALLLLGALRTIPDSLYKAARMDGAGAWASFRIVTLPTLRPTLIVVAVTSVVFSLQSIDILFTLTGGGPGRSTTVITWYIYESAIGRLSFGYSSALAVILLALIALFSSLLILVQRKRKPRRVGDDDISGLRSMSLAPLAGWAAPPRRASPRRRRIARVAGRVAAITGATLLAIWLIGPVLWIALASLQPESGMTSLPLRLSGDIRWSNYVDLVRQPEWQSALWVSLRLVVLVTLFTLLVCALAAFPLARQRVPGQRFIIGGLVATQMVPAIVLVIPVLLTFRYIGLKDTVTALVLVNVAFWIPLIVWLLRNVFQEVPRHLEAAARMDGYSRLGALFRVVVPAARPGLAATAILLLVGTWNEFLFAVILGDREAVTVTRVIGFIGQSAAGPDGPPPVTLIAAAGISAFLPCLVLVLFFYKRLVTGLSTSSVKG